jgi:hypothetical protein
VEIRGSVDEKPALHFCCFDVLVLFLDYDLRVSMEERGRSTRFITAMILGR